MTFLSIITTVTIYFMISTRILKEMERGVVFRLGRLNKIIGPGFVFVLWPVEQIIKIDLNQIIPEWQRILKEELNEKIKQKALSGEIKKLNVNI